MIKNRTIRQNTGDALGRILVAAYALNIAKLRGTNDSINSLLEGSKDIIDIMISLGYDIDEKNPERMYGNLMGILTQHFGQISSFDGKDLLQETSSNPYKLSVRYDKHGLIVKIGKHVRTTMVDGVKVTDPAKMEFMVTYKNGKSTYNPNFEAMLNEYIDNVNTLPQIGGKKIVGFTNEGEPIQKELSGINDDRPYSSIQVDGTGKVYLKKFDTYNDAVFSRTLTHLAPAKLNGKNYYFLNPVIALEDNVSMQAIPQQVTDDELVVIEKVRKIRKTKELEVKEPTEEPTEGIEVNVPLDEVNQIVEVLPEVPVVEDKPKGPKKLVTKKRDTGGLQFAMESLPDPKLKKEVGGKEFTRTPCNPM
jgi:hypothetical protein